MLHPWRHGNTLVRLQYSLAKKAGLQFVQISDLRQQHPDLEHHLDLVLPTTLQVLLLGD
jgi:hypothetical protein